MLLRLLRDLVKHRSPVVIATHSPLLLGILQLTPAGVRAVAWEDTAHDFLNDRERCLEVAFARHDGCV